MYPRDTKKLYWTMYFVSDNKCDNLDHQLALDIDYAE